MDRLLVDKTGWQGIGHDYAIGCRAIIRQCYGNYITTAINRLGAQAG